MVELTEEEETRQTIEGLRKLQKDLKGNPELARDILRRLDHRPLANQPEVSPKESYDRWLDAYAAKLTNGVKTGK